MKKIAPSVKTATRKKTKTEKFHEALDTTEQYWDKVKAREIKKTTRKHQEEKKQRLKEAYSGGSPVTYPKGALDPNEVPPIISLGNLLSSIFSRKFLKPQPYSMAEFISDCREGTSEEIVARLQARGLSVTQHIPKEFNWDNCVEFLEEKVKGLRRITNG